MHKILAAINESREQGGKKKKTKTKTFMNTVANSRGKNNWSSGKLPTRWSKNCQFNK